MNDAFGTEIKIGDRVVTNHTQYNSTFVFGRVKGFSVKRVRIELEDSEKFGWGTQDCARFPNQVIVAPDPLTQFRYAMQLQELLAHQSNEQR